MMIIKYLECYTDEERLVIPYYELVTKINGNDFRKLFIVDIRKMDYEKVLSQFDYIQDTLVEDDYFNKSLDKCYPTNLGLYFLCDDDISRYFRNVLENYVYALKKFINTEEYEKLIKEPLDLLVKERKNIYLYNHKEIEAGNFNLIIGNNGSGKTQLLRFISEQRKTPIFLLNRSVSDPNKIFSNESEYLKNLDEIINYCKSRNMPLLLDDLCWGGMGGRGPLTIIDILYDYSHENDVFFTAAQSQIKGLVKKRSHTPNIIELKNSVH